MAQMIQIGRFQPLRAWPHRHSSASSSISRLSCHAVVDALVLPHHTHAHEPHRRVAADRRLVGERRIDRQPMVAAGLEEVAHGVHRLAAEPPPLPRPAEEDVDGGAAVHGVGDLVVLDQSRDGSANLDREELAVFGMLEVVVADSAPPSPHVRLPTDRDERGRIGVDGGPEAQPRPLQLWRSGHHGARNSASHRPCSRGRIPFCVAAEPFGADP